MASAASRATPIMSPAAEPFGGHFFALWVMASRSTTSPRLFSFPRLVHFRKSPNCLTTAFSFSPSQSHPKAPERVTVPS